MTNPNVAFTLRVRLYRSAVDKRLITITAYDDLGWDEAGRVKLTVEVRHGGQVIFPRGQLTCALHGSSDSNAAKECVMSLVAMKLGDTDRDYFADYSPEQLDWAGRYGDLLTMEAHVRYCDENGNVRS